MFVIVFPAWDLRAGIQKPDNWIPDQVRDDAIVSFDC